MRWARGTGLVATGVLLGYGLALWVHPAQAPSPAPGESRVEASSPQPARPTEAAPTSPSTPAPTSVPPPNAAEGEPTPLDPAPPAAPPASPPPSEPLQSERPQPPVEAPRPDPAREADREGALWTPPRLIPPEPAPQAPPPGSGLVNGMAFGRRVVGVRPELLDALRAAEKKTAPRLRPDGSTPSADDWGVYTLIGFRPGSRAHQSGLAVDVNYYANPYLMHEKGEESLDARLGPVYHRISRLILGRASVIPAEMAQGAPSPERALHLFRMLREESGAMVRYFALMRDRPALRSFLEQVARSPQRASALPAGMPADAAELQLQMMRDYTSLAGRPGPKVPGLEYPASPPTAAGSEGGDPPFSGDPRYRGPEQGYLMLREEVFRALIDSGMRWGGSDMGRQSGDLMHFYLPAATAARAR